MSEYQRTFSVPNSPGFSEPNYEYRSYRPDINTLEKEVSRLNNIRVENFVATANTVPWALRWATSSETDVIFNAGGKLKNFTISAFDFDLTGKNAGLTDLTKTINELKARADMFGIAPGVVGVHTGTTTDVTKRQQQAELQHYKYVKGDLIGQALEDARAQVSDPDARLPDKAVTFNTNMYTGVRIAGIQITGSGGFFDDRNWKVGGMYRDEATTTTNPYIVDLVEEFERNPSARGGVHTDETHLPGYALTQNESIYSEINSRLKTYAKAADTIPEDQRASKLKAAGAMVTLSGPSMGMSEASIADSAQNLSQRQLVVENLNLVLKMSKQGFQVNINYDPERIAIPADLKHQLMTSKNIHFLRNKGGVDAWSHANIQGVHMNLDSSNTPELIKSLKEQGTLASDFVKGIAGFISVGTERLEGSSSLNQANIVDFAKALSSKSGDMKLIVQQNLEVLNRIYGQNRSYDFKRDAALEDGGMMLREFYTPTFKDKQRTGFEEEGKLPYMPTSMPTAFFSYYQTGTKTHMYTDRYRAVYRRAPEGTQAYILGTLDRKLSDPGFGMMLNARFSQNDLYTPGEGLIGALSNSVGRVMDTLSGFYMFQTLKAQQNGDLHGALSKYYDKSQSDPYENLNTRGFFENFFHVVTSTASGTALSMATYFGVTHGYNIAKAEIESVGVNYILKSLQEGHESHSTNIFTNALLNAQHQDIFRSAGVINHAKSLNNRGAAINTYFQMMQDVVLERQAGFGGLPDEIKDAHSARNAVIDQSTELTALRKNLVDNLNKTGSQALVNHLNNQVGSSLTGVLNGTYTEANINDVFNQGYKELGIHKEQQLINLGHSFDSSLTGVSVARPSSFGNLAAVRRMDSSNVNNVFLPLLREMVDLSTDEQKTKFASAVYQLNHLAKQPPLLSYNHDIAADANKKGFAILNYGFERIENLAKVFDDISVFIPANPFMWFKPLRHAFRVQRAIPNLSVGTEAINPPATFRDLIGPGFTGLLTLTKDVWFATKEMMRIGVSTHLQGTFDTFAKQRSINLQERKIVNALKQGGGNVLETLNADPIKAMLANVEKDMGSLKQMIAAKPGYKNNLTPIERPGQAFTTFRKVFFSLGTFLIADKLLDTFVFRPQGTDLIDSILSDVWGTKSPASSEDGYKEDHKYQGLYETNYSNAVPASVKYPAAAAGYFVGGYVFPAVYQDESLVNKYIKTLGNETRDGAFLKLKDELKTGYTAERLIAKTKFGFHGALIGAAAGLIVSQLMTSYIAATVKPMVQAIDGMFSGRRRQKEGGMEIEPIHGTAAAALARVVEHSMAIQKARKSATPNEQGATQTLNLYVQSLMQPAIKPGRTFYPFATQMAFPFFQFASVAKIDPKGNKIDMESGLQLFPLLGVGLMIPFPLTPKVKYTNSLVEQELVKRLNQIPADMIAPYRQLTQATQDEYAAMDSFKMLGGVTNMLLGSGLNVSLDQKPIVLIGMLGAAATASQKMEALARGLSADSVLRKELEQYKTAYNLTKFAVKSTDRLIRGAFSLSVSVSNALLKAGTSLLGVGGSTMVRMGAATRVLAPYYLSASIIGGLMRPGQTGGESELGGLNDVLQMFSQGQYEGATNIYQQSVMNQVLQTGIGTAIFGTALHRSGAFDNVATFANTTGNDYISQRKHMLFQMYEEHLATNGLNADEAKVAFQDIKDELKTAKPIRARELLERLQTLELPLIRSAPIRYGMAARKIAPLLIGFTAAAQVLALTDFYKNPYMSGLFKAIADTGRGDYSPEQKAFLAQLGIKGLKYQPKDMGQAISNVGDYLWGAATALSTNPIGAYQDAPNPFLGVLGPLGVADQNDNARFYFQSQSVAADISGSLYIMPAMISDMATSLEMGPIIKATNNRPNLNATTAMAIMRGSYTRRKAATIRGGPGQSELSSVTSPELQMAISRRMAAIQQLTWQTGGQHIFDMYSTFSRAGRVAGDFRDGKYTGVRQRRNNVTPYDSVLRAARTIGVKNSRDFIRQKNPANNDALRVLKSMGRSLAGHDTTAIIEAQEDFGSMTYGSRLQDAGPNPIFGYFGDLFKFAFSTFYDPDTDTTGSQSNNVPGALLMAGGALVLAGSFIGTSVSTAIQMIGAMSALHEYGTMADTAGNIDSLNRNITRRLQGTRYWTDKTGALGRIVNGRTGTAPVKGLIPEKVEQLNLLYSTGGESGELQKFADTLGDEARKLASTSEAHEIERILTELDAKFNAVRNPTGRLDVRQILNPDLTTEYLANNSKFFDNESLRADIGKFHTTSKTLDVTRLSIWNRLQSHFFSHLESDELGYSNTFTSGGTKPQAQNPQFNYSRKSGGPASKVVSAFDDLKDTNAAYIRNKVSEVGYTGLAKEGAGGLFRALGSAVDFKAYYEALSYSASALGDPNPFNRRRASRAAATNIVYSFGMLLPAQALLALAAKQPMIAMGAALVAGVAGSFALTNKSVGNFFGKIFNPIIGFSDRRIVKPTITGIESLLNAAGNNAFFSLIGQVARPIANMIDPMFVAMRRGLVGNPALAMMGNILIPETVDSFYDRLTMQSGQNTMWGPRQELHSNEELAQYRKGKVKNRRQRASIRNAGIDSDLVNPFLLGRGGGETVIESEFRRRYLGGEGRIMESFVPESLTSNIMKLALERRQGELDSFGIGTSYLRSPFIRTNAYQMMAPLSALNSYSYRTTGSLFQAPMNVFGRGVADGFGLYAGFRQKFGSKLPGLSRALGWGTFGGVVASSFLGDNKDQNWYVPAMGAAAGGAFGIWGYPRLQDKVVASETWSVAVKLGTKINKKLEKLSPVLTGLYHRVMARMPDWLASAKRGAPAVLGTGALITAAIYSNYDWLYRPWDGKARQERRERDGMLTPILWSAGLGFGSTFGGILSLTSSKSSAIASEGIANILKGVGKGTTFGTRAITSGFIIYQALNMPVVSGFSRKAFGLWTTYFTKDSEATENANYNFLTQAVATAGGLAIPAYSIWNANRLSNINSPFGAEGNSLLGKTAKSFGEARNTVKNAALKNALLAQQVFFAEAQMATGNFILQTNRLSTGTANRLGGAITSLKPTQLQLQLALRQDQYRKLAAESEAQLNVIRRESNIFRAISHDAFTALKWGVVGAFPVVLLLKPVFKGASWVVKAGAKKVVNDFKWAKGELGKHVPPGLRTWINEEVAPHLKGFLTNELYGLTEETVESSGRIRKFGKALTPFIAPAVPLVMDAAALTAGVYQISQLNYARSGQDFAASYSSFYSTIGALTTGSLLALAGNKAGFLRTAAVVLQSSGLGAQYGERVASERFIDSQRGDDVYQSGKVLEYAMAGGTAALSLINAGVSYAIRNPESKLGSFIPSGYSSLRALSPAGREALKALNIVGTTLPSFFQAAISTSTILRLSSADNQQFRYGDTAAQMGGIKSELTSTAFSGAFMYALTHAGSWKRTAAATVLAVGAIGASALDETFTREQVKAFREAGISDTYTQNLISKQAAESMTPWAIGTGFVAAGLAAFLTKGKSLGATFNAAIAGFAGGVGIGGLGSYQFNTMALTNRYRDGNLPADQAAIRNTWQGTGGLPAGWAGNRQDRIIKGQSALFENKNASTDVTDFISMAPVLKESLPKEVLQAGQETLQRRSMDQPFGMREIGLGTVGLGIGTWGLSTAKFELLSTSAEKFWGVPGLKSMVSHAGAKVLNPFVVTGQAIMTGNALRQLATTPVSSGNARVEYARSMAAMRSETFKAAVNGAITGLPAGGWGTEIALFGANQALLASTEPLRSKWSMQNTYRFLDEHPEIKLTSELANRAKGSYAKAAENNGTAQIVAGLSAIGAAAAVVLMAGAATITLPVALLAAGAAAGAWALGYWTSASAIAERRQENVLLGTGDKKTGRDSQWDDTNALLNPGMAFTYGVGMAMFAGGSYLALKGYNKLKARAEDIKRNGHRPGSSNGPTTPSNPSGGNGGGGSGLNTPTPDPSSPSGDTVGRVNAPANNSPISAPQNVVSDVTSSVSSADVISRTVSSNTSQVVPAVEQSVLPKPPNPAQTLTPKQVMSQLEVLQNDVRDAKFYNDLSPDARTGYLLRESRGKLKTFATDNSTIIKANRTLAQVTQIVEPQVLVSQPTNINHVKPQSLNTDTSNILENLIEVDCPTCAKPAVTAPICPNCEGSLDLVRRIMTASDSELLEIKGLFDEAKRNFQQPTQLPKQDAGFFRFGKSANSKPSTPIEFLSKSITNSMARFFKSVGNKVNNFFYSSQTKKIESKQTTPLRAASPALTNVQYNEPSNFGIDNSYESYAQNSARQRRRSRFTRTALGASDYADLNNSMSGSKLPQQPRVEPVYIPTEPAPLVEPPSITYDYGTTPEIVPTSSANMTVARSRPTRTYSGPTSRNLINRVNKPVSPSTKTPTVTQRGRLIDSFVETALPNMAEFEVRPTTDLTPLNVDVMNVEMPRIVTNTLNMMPVRGSTPRSPKTIITDTMLAEGLSQRGTPRTTIKDSPTVLNKILDRFVDEEITPRIAQSKQNLDHPYRRMSTQRRNGGFVNILGGGIESNPYVKAAVGATRKVAGASNQAFWHEAGSQFGFGKGGFSWGAFKESQLGKLNVVMTAVDTAMQVFEDTQIKKLSLQQTAANAAVNIGAGLLMGAAIGGGVAAIGAGLTAAGFVGAAAAFTVAAPVALLVLGVGMLAYRGYGLVNEYDKQRNKGQAQSVPSVWRQRGVTPSQERLMVNRMTTQRNAGALYSLQSIQGKEAKKQEYVDAVLRKETSTKDKPWWQQMVDGILSGFTIVGRGIKSTFDWAKEQAGKATATVGSFVSGSISNQGLTGNASIIADFFAAQGFTKAGIAGVLGTFQQESRLDPHIVNPSSGAIGLAQWLYERKTNMPKITGDAKTDLMNQLNYVMAELNGKNGEGLNGKILKTLRFTTDVNVAVKAMDAYERFAGWQNAATGKETGSRYINARDFVNKFDLKQGQVISNTYNVGSSIISIDSKNTELYSSGGGFTKLNSSSTFGATRGHHGGKKEYTTAFGQARDYVLKINGTDNAPLRTAMDAKVSFAGWRDGYGYTVELSDLNNKPLARYGHFAPGSLKVKTGNVIKAGDILGTQGNSGASHGVHSHLEASKDYQTAWIQSVTSGQFKTQVGGLQSFANGITNGVSNIFSSNPNVGTGRVTETYITEKRGASDKHGGPRSGRQHAGQDFNVTASTKNQTYLGGVITRVAYQGGADLYNNYIDIYNPQLGVVERIAEFGKPQFTKADIGKVIPAGTTVGIGSTSGPSVVHREIRTDLNGQKQAGFGYKGTLDTLDFLQSRGYIRVESIVIGGVRAKKIVPIGSSNSAAASSQNNPILNIQVPNRQTGKITNINASNVKSQIQVIPQNRIALTFDDGPDPNWTPKVLDVLKQHGAKATFFVVGERALKYPGLIRRAIAEGHEIGLHSMSHDRFDKMSSSERIADVKKELAILKTIAPDYTPTTFRFPYGAGSYQGQQSIQRDLNSLGLSTIYWSSDTEDWKKNATGPGIAREILRVGGGDIVLMHDALDAKGNPKATTSKQPVVDALRIALPQLEKKGIRSVPINQLYGLSNNQVSVPVKPARTKPVVKTPQRHSMVPQEVRDHIVALSVAPTHEELAKSEQITAELTAMAYSAVAKVKEKENRRVTIEFERSNALAINPGQFAKAVMKHDQKTAKALPAASMEDNVLHVWKSIDPTAMIDLIASRAPGDRSEEDVGKKPRATSSNPA